MTHRLSLLRAAMMHIFDVGNKASFERVKTEMAHVFNTHGKDNSVHMLVGNHYWYQDKQRKREVTQTEAEDLALEHDIDYCECDTKNHDSVRLAFVSLVWRAWDVRPRTGVFFMSREGGPGEKVK